MSIHYEKQLEKISSQGGFLAALDQSGGSTPKALKLYGINEDSYVVGEDSMFDKMHEFRVRMMKSSAFTGKRILGAILFESTLRRTVPTGEGDASSKPTSEFLWDDLGVVPFLKIDQGLMAEENGVQNMKEMTKLTSLLDLAVEQKVFGTKARSLIKKPNAEGIKSTVEQQFEIAMKVIERGMHPIVEPEVDITLPDEDKKEAESLLKAALLESLNKLKPNEKVLLKVSLPTVENFYKECIEHPNVIRVVALSGGYDRDTANAKLAKNGNMIGSFSRALTEGLNVNDTAEEFDQKLDTSIESIYQASVAGGN